MGLWDPVMEEAPCEQTIVLSRRPYWYPQAFDVAVELFTP